MFGPEKWGEGRKLGDSGEGNLGIVLRGDLENEEGQLEGGLCRLLAGSVWVSKQIGGYNTKMGLGIVLWDY